MAHEEPTGPSPDDAAPAAPGSEEVIRQFVEHWGVMARAWGINATMGEIFALLYITGTDWTADALRDWLQVSRGNVSMNLRELRDWGVVHKVHRQGQRREFYRAEGDVWTLFRRILAERKRRELDPTLSVLDRTAARVGRDSALRPLGQRVESLRQFFALINTLAIRLATLEPEQAQTLNDLLAPPAEDRDA